jgi:hypothetical protein
MGENPTSAIFFCVCDKTPQRPEHWTLLANIYARTRSPVRAARALQCVLPTAILTAQMQLVPIHRGLKSQAAEVLGGGSRNCGDCSAAVCPCALTITRSHQQVYAQLVPVLGGL